MRYPIAFVHLTVKTESGAKYLIRSHGKRAYVTRLGSVAMDGAAPCNKVTTQPIDLVEGRPMVVRFEDGRFIRTTPVRTVSYEVVTV